jgi:hypothetical protein
MFYRFSYPVSATVFTVPPFVIQACAKYKESLPVKLPPAFVVECIKTFPPSLDASIVKTPVDLHIPSAFTQVASGGQILRPPTVFVPAVVAGS